MCEPPTPERWFSAVILAGGRSQRLGGRDKSQLSFAGETLLERGLQASAAACHRVVVAPESRGVPAGVTRVLEDPPFGGPAAGIGAGLGALAGLGCHSGWTLVLACDLPQAPDAVAALLAHCDAEMVTERVVPIDSTGSPQNLLGLYRRDVLARAIAAHDGARNLSVRRVVASLTTITHTLPDELLSDVDDAESAQRHGIRLMP